MGQHVARYAWAMNVCDRKRVVELGCGDGYGSYLLSWSASEVIGLDVDAAAIGKASRRYANVMYRQADITDSLCLPEAEIAICFEVLEHLDDPKAALAGALARYPRLLVSFPNPIFHGTHLNPHHRTDWSAGRLRSVLRELGASRIQTYHQSRRGSAIRLRGFPWSSIWLFDVLGPAKLQPDRRHL
jgi:trans-aconitate methyltransferase